jgi:hypothetical protein
MSVSLHTRLTAVTHLTDGEFLQVAVNREEFLTLREGTRIPIVLIPFATVVGLDPVN